MKDIGAGDIASGFMSKPHNSVSEALNTLSDFSNQHTGNDSTEIACLPLVPSLNFATAFQYETEFDLISYHKDKFNGQRYARDSSSLVLQIEKILSHISDSNNCLLFSSGMKAIWAVMWSILDRIDTIISFGTFYRKSLSCIEEISNKCSKRHLNVSSLNDLLPSSFKSDERIMFYVESPSNPLLKVCDISAIRQDFPNSIIIYDNSLAGLCNDKININESDFVVSSCTKYIGGHNDLLGGLVLLRNSLDYENLWSVRSTQGGIMDQMSAYLLFRSLKTYDVRMKNMSHNALLAVDFLKSHPSVKSVFYPGKSEDREQNEIFQKCYKNGAGLILFEIIPEYEEKLSLNLQKLHSTKIAPSFGSTDSLMERPAIMSQYGKSETELAEIGLNKRFVRFSVGMEPFNFIKADLERVLN